MPGLACAPPSRAQRSLPRPFATAGSSAASSSLLPRPAPRASRGVAAGRRALGPAALGKAAQQEPLEARVLSGILGVSNTPYSSYVPEPRGFLHDIHAAVKQAWLVVLLVVTARSQSPLLIAGGTALVSVAALPPRLWREQLKRLGLLALFIFVTTAIFADGIPPAVQARHLPPDLEGLPPVTPGSPGYRYVLFHWLFITVTQRSLQLARSAACLTFTALQSASLCLTTTPAEELAAGVGAWLAPLRLVGAPVAEMRLTLLLSLRFLAVVFEEIRNLALGLAARNVDWRGMGRGAGVQVSLRMLGRLFSNLMRSSETIAVAMCARGFAGPQAHALPLPCRRPPKPLPNLLATAALIALVAGCVQRVL